MNFNIKKHNTKNKESSNSDDIFFSFKTLRGKGETVRPKKEDNEEVINIYHKNMPRRLERKPRKGLQVFFGGLLVLIIFGGIFYYYGRSLFLGDQIFGGDNVELEIEGLGEVAAGEEITYIIKYQNLAKVDLSNVVLDVNYPSGFIYKKAKPLPTGTNNDSWDLGYMRSGRSGKIEITGSLIGTNEQVEKLSAELKYNLGSNKSGGSQKAEIETKIASSILDLEISGPTQLIGEEMEYIIKYTNKSNTTIEDIKIMVAYPEGFTFTSSKPSPQEDSEDSVWLVNQLVGEESKELIIKGRFPAFASTLDNTSIAEPAEDLTQQDDIEATADEGSKDKEKILKVQIGILDAQDIFYVQQEKEFVTIISTGDVAINLELNGSADNSIVGLDEILIYVVSYNNQSKLELQDVKLKLTINSNILDWTSLEDEAEGLVVDEEIISGMLARSITWEVDKINPEDEGSFTIKIKSKPYSKLNKTNTLDLRAEARVQAIIDQIDGEKVNKIIEGSKLVAQVNTDLKLQTIANLQNSNEYQISWQLTNSIHEVEQIKVEASLGDGVSWMADSSLSAGDIYFDPENKTVSWQLNRIPVGVDIPLTAKFKLKTATDGRPKLLTNLSLSAIDKITGAQIAQSFSEVMGE
jgi:uncharacterized repeat protein (TIGR01451 family)